MITFKEYIQEEHGAGEWGTDKLVKRYKKDTPGQMDESLKLGSNTPVYREYEGMGRTALGNLQGQGIQEAIRKRKKKFLLFQIKKKTLKIKNNPS